MGDGRVSGVPGDLGVLEDPGDLGDRLDFVDFVGTKESSSIITAMSSVEQFTSVIACITRALGYYCVCYSQ